MNRLLKFAILLIGQHAKMRLLREVKRKGVLAYLKLIQGSRRALLAVLLALFAFQLMVTALVGAIVCGVLLCDWDFQLKMQILCGVFATLFIVPALGLAFVFSERFWFKASGAERLIRETGPRGSDRAA